MSIRAKFFALAGILLLLFGAVVGLLTLLQDATAHKLADIVYYYQPLRRALADLDVDTFARLSAFSVMGHRYWIAQKMSSEAMNLRAWSSGSTVRPNGPALVHRSFHSDQ